MTQLTQPVDIYASVAPTDYFDLTYTILRKKTQQNTKNMNSLLLCIFIVYLNVARFSCLPVVDSGSRLEKKSWMDWQICTGELYLAGLFVIQGVSTCGQGLGYCFLSDSCLVDTNFDIDLSGHCDGLKRAFNPNTNFVCCQTAKEETTIIATETVPATHSPVQVKKKKMRCTSAIHRLIQRPCYRNRLPRRLRRRTTVINQKIIATY